MKTLRKELYSPKLKDWKQSLDIAETVFVNTLNDEPLTFNLLWLGPRDFGRKQLAIIKSILANHKDPVIHLWTNLDLFYNEYFQQVAPYIHLRQVEPLDGDDYKHYMSSDYYRLRMLKEHGGFWIDFDVLVLRDMSPLNMINFAYQLGTSGFNVNEPEMMMNNAVMRLDKDGEIVNELLDLLGKTRGIPSTYCWGSDLFKRLTGDRITCLPGIWFESAGWGHEGLSKHENIFTDNGTIEMLPGAFTAHWHNKWDHDIHPNSKFQYIEQNHNLRIQNKVRIKLPI
jgi:hypothetical protein